MPQNWCYCHFHFDPFRAVKILYSYFSSSSIFFSSVTLCPACFGNWFSLRFYCCQDKWKMGLISSSSRGKSKNNNNKTVGAPSVRCQQVGVTHTHRERIEQFVWERDRDSWSCYPGLWVNLSGRDLSGHGRRDKGEGLWKEGTYPYTCIAFYCVPPSSFCCLFTTVKLSVCEAFALTAKKETRRSRSNRRRRCRRN